MRIETPEEKEDRLERQRRKAKAWRERHPERYRESRRKQDAKRVLKPRIQKPTRVTQPKPAKPKQTEIKNLADRPAAIAIRERFLDWREERKERR